MSQGHQQAAQPQTVEQIEDLLEKVLEREPSKRFQIVQGALDARIEKLREVLPADLKDQAERFVKRAMIEFDRNERLQECTAASIVRCVLQAAELGLTIDGRLAHAVPYNNKKKIDGREVWRKESQLQLDYKGLIAVAKRSGQIIDIRGDVVCEHDSFEHGTSGTTSRCDHNYDHKAERGDVVAAYAVVYLPGGLWKYALMQKDELLAIRGRSKSFSGKGGSPWKTDFNQMCVKTVMRRALKLYCDDPSVGGALAADEYDYEDTTNRNDTRRVSRSPLNDSMQVPVAKPQSQFAEPPEDEPTGDPHPEVAADAAENMGEHTPGPDPPPDMPDALTEYSASIHSVKTKTKVEGCYEELAAGAFGQVAKECLDAAKALRDWKLRQLAGPKQGTLI